MTLLEVENRFLDLDVGNHLAVCGKKRKKIEKNGNCDAFGIQELRGIHEKLYHNFLNFIFVYFRTREKAVSGKNFPEKNSLFSFLIFFVKKFFIIVLDFRTVRNFLPAFFRHSKKRLVSVTSKTGEFS